jgi:hypothetical protein
MHPVLSQCPICQSDLVITQLHCQTCATSIQGEFFGGPFAQLSREQLAFVETFVRCEGKLNRMEGELSLSYPTVRNRLHEIIRALGYEPGGEEEIRGGLNDNARQNILEDLNQGNISIEDAMKLLAK